jgi:CheY-like chemotaxis protein
MVTHGSEHHPFLRGLEILFVDNSPDERDLICVRLGPFGARVTAVQSVLDALGVLDRDPIDVIVCDIFMPAQSGFDLLRAVRARAPGNGGWIPVIAATGYAAVADDAEAGRVAFADVLVKPYDTGELVSKLERAARAVEQVRLVRGGTAARLPRH